MTKLLLSDIFASVERRDIIIGVIVLAVIAALVLYLRRPKTLPTTFSIPTPSSVQKNIEKTFNVQIPENVEKAELTGESGMGIATREFANGKYVYTILVNLDEPSSGNFYAGWLVRGKAGDSNYSVVSLGKLRVAKGGWLVDFESSVNYSDYKNVLVTLEKSLMGKPGKEILTGSF